MKTPNALLPLLSLVCIWTALGQATHSSLTNSHARRSLARAHQKRYGHPTRLQDEKRDLIFVSEGPELVNGVETDVEVLRDSDTGDIIYLDTIATSIVSISYASTSTTSASTTTSTASTTDSSSSTTTTDSSSSTTTASSTSTTDSSSSTTTTDSSSSTTTTDSTTSATTTTDSSTTTTTDSSTPTDTSTVSVTDSASSTITDAPTSTSDSVSATITTQPASSSTSCDLLDVGCVVSSITSDVGSILSNTASTSDVIQTTDSSSPTTTTTTATPTDTQASSSYTPTSTSDAVSDILSTATSILQTTTTPTATPTSDSSSPTDSSTPSQTQSNQQTDTQISGTVTQTSYVQTQTITASDSPTDSATASITHTQSVSFPTFSSSPTDSGVTATATDSVASDSVTDTQATLTITTQAIPSEYSYITESSLELTSLPATSTIALTITDPDAAFTTASLTQSGTASPTQAITIPSGLPTRIFPANRLDPNDPSLEGMSIISLMFSKGLTWPFVVNSTNTAALLFVYTPQALQNALGLTSDQVLTYAMQAYAPADYTGDITQLSTVYLLYIPADQVTVLQQQLLTPNSPLYTNQAGIPKQISQQLDASFPVNAVGVDTAIVGSGNTASGSSADAAGASSASRRDAIIGVCAAFGVILLAVVVWWGYKSWRRRQDKAHRRLTHDSAGMHQAGGYGATTQTAYAYGGVYGAAPQRSGYAQPNTPLYTTNGQPAENPFDDGSFEDDYETRRRSFFFAEDSLRGYHVPREEEQGITYTQLMRQQQGLAPNDKRRAPIQASAISAPILRESSLNW